MKLEINEVNPLEDQDSFSQLVKALEAISNAAPNLSQLSPSMAPLDQESLAARIRGHKGQGLHYFWALGQEGQVMSVMMLQVPEVKPQDSPAKAKEGPTKETPEVKIQRPQPPGEVKLTLLAVEPRAQGRNVGKVMTRKALEVAQSLGAKSLRVEVFADNRRMLRLLLGLGFVPRSFKEETRQDGMGWLVLTKPLTPA